MYPKSLYIKDVRGIKEIEFAPASFNVISGKNGVGKSSIIASIVYMGERSHDPSMLRNGAEEGIIRLLIGDETGEYDGAIYICTITAGRTSRVLDHPKLGKISVSKSKEWFETVINMISLDPTRFLNAKDSDQIRMFLEASPQKLTAEQLQFIPENIIKKQDLNEHALKIIDRIRDEIFDKRKSNNAIAKDKRATARTTRQGLPDDAPGEDWEHIYSDAQKDLRALNENEQVKARNIEKKYGDMRAEIKNSLQEFKDNLAAELNRKIEELRKAVMEESMTAESKAQEDLDSIERQFRKEFSEAQSNYVSKRGLLTEQIGKAGAMVTAHEKSQVARDLADKMDKEAKALEKLSAEYTEQLNKLDELKTGLLNQIPIPGLEIKDGVLYDNGVKFSAQNDAEKFRIMFEIGKLISGNMGFMVLDHAEFLDDENWAALVEAGSKAGMRIIAAKRTRGPLEISTTGKE